MIPQDQTRRVSEWIKQKAAELGFSACGISRAEKLQEEEKHLVSWLEEGCQGEMSWMARNRDKRTDPRMLLDGARSVISVLMNYYPADPLPKENNYKIARYAYGRDYHDVIRKRLNLLIEDLRLKVGSVGQSDRDLTPFTPRPHIPPLLEERGPGGEVEPWIFKARAFTDSAPVLDKSWAERAGLGWIGKNTCLIHPKIGSYVFVGEIITNLELEYDANTVNDLCGGCTRCLEACPTGAIIAPRVLDARKCISYLTIEYKGELPAEERGKFQDWIFGCDICQEVCPWNRKAEATCIEAFRPSEELKAMNKEKWHALTREDYNGLFKGSAVKRSKFDGLKRNIEFLSE